LVKHFLLLQEDINGDLARGGAAFMMSSNERFVAFLVKELFSIFLGISLINSKFFWPKLGTRNAKTLFGPFKVTKFNQKAAKLKKIDVI